MEERDLTLGEIILEARKKKGYTLRQCAALVLKEDGTPISFPYLNDVENGRRSPSEYIIEQLSVVLDLPIEYLYFYAEVFPKGLNKKAEREQIIAAYKSFAESLR